MLHWNEYIKIFVAVMVIVDPIGAIPLFLSLTGNQSNHERRHTAKIAAFAMAVVLIISCLFGDTILRFFGISMASFRVAGCILLLFLGIAMMHARQSTSKHTPEEDKEAESKESVAVVPMAMPLLAGPGAISMLIIYSQEAPLWAHKGILIGCCLIAAVAIWATMLSAIHLSKGLGKTGINITTRVMGLILTAVAVEFIATGLGQLFPGLIH
ncbi:MAG: YchE family NAAT transporter [candidate division Zixibacteria bacterium]|nr:YchE family NAAT transporter [candidate division Zixibacteria bacterium]